MKWIIFGLCFLIFCCQDSRALSAPTFCTYDATENTYTCEYASMSNSDRPIPLADFDPIPQHLIVTANGFFPAFGSPQVFHSDFATINTTGFDPNFAATLTVDCGWSGSLYMQDGAFYNMSYVQKLYIKNCNIWELTSEGFKDLGELDYFGIIYGTVDSVNPNAMTGTDVKKLTNDYHVFPDTQGAFEMKYSEISGGVVPPGLLFNWKFLTTLTLRGVGLSSLTKDVFKYNTKLRTLDLSENTFTSIPSGIFDYHPDLAVVILEEIKWDCTCDNLWFVAWANRTGVKLVGDLKCSGTTGTSVKNYYYANCIVVEACDKGPGLVLFGGCMVVTTIVVYLCSFVAFVVMIVSLALSIHFRRRCPAEGVRGGRGAGGARSRWSKIANATKNKAKANWDNVLKSMKKK